MCLRRKTVVDKYDELMTEQQFIMDTISNLGREKDYKVQKIEKEYDSKLDILYRKAAAIDLQVEIAKRYVANTVVDDANPVAKIIPTTRKKERS